MNPKKIFALSVGIGRYRQLPNLVCPPTDAQDFADVVQSGPISSEIKVLRDSDATRESILKELGWLAKVASPSETAILFFSGHGGRSSDGNDQAYFCPVDASLLNLNQTCITSAELSDALRAIKAERLIVMLDTCYSGGIGEPRRRSVGVPSGLNSRDVHALVEGTGRVILAASRPDEPAWELSGMRNGLFTNYLLRALRGEVARADGSIWATDVFSYVSRGVRQHRCQRPYQKAVGEDFVVMVQQNKVTQVRVPALAASVVDQRQLRLAMRRAYNRDDLSILCHDLGLRLEDLPGRTLETQLMDLIDHCDRHGLYDQLLDMTKAERPHLALV
jgi:hypothetical protein